MCVESFLPSSPSFLFSILQWISSQIVLKYKWETNFLELQNLVTGVVFSSKWRVIIGIGKSLCVSCFIEVEELPHISPMLWHSLNTVRLWTCCADHRKRMLLWKESKQLFVNCSTWRQRGSSVRVREQNGTFLMTSICSCSLSFMSTIESWPVSRMTDPLAWAMYVLKRQIAQLGAHCTSH